MDLHAIEKPETFRKTRVGLTTKRPDMIYRQVWDTTSTKVQLNFTEFVLVSHFRTTRLKEPKVDLLYSVVE
jgi:hypothetical protein